MVMRMLIVVKVLITEPHHNHPGVQAVRAFNLAINIPLPSKAPLLSLLMHHIQQHHKKAAANHGAPNHARACVRAMIITEQ